MGKELLLRLSFFVLCVAFYGNTEVSKPTVILEPSGPVVYRGEKVTLRCEIPDDGGTQWTYEWRTNNGNSPEGSSEYIIDRVSDTDSGYYSCMARRDYQLTEWSDDVTLTVRPDEPRAKLTADRTIIPAGGSITLTCSVDESDDWKFDWFRNDQQYSVDRFRGNNEPHSYISVSDGGLYRCLGKRGDPVFQTEQSNEVSVLKTVSKSTVILQPSGPDVYRGEKVTLRCEIQDDGGTQWMYIWKRYNRISSKRSSEYIIDRVSDTNSGPYSCLATGDYQLTEWSDDVTLTVRPYKPRAELTADRTIIPAGGSITLSCSVDESDDWKFDWFRNYQQYSAAQFRSNDKLYRIIIVSEGGVYSCRGGRGNPVFYTEKSNIQKIVSGPTVNQHPSWPVVFRGETVTLRCEMQDDEGTQWTYEWSPTYRYFPTSNEYRNSPTSIEYKINRVSESDTGNYRCKASKGDETGWSSDFTLTVNSNEPKASLKTSDNIIPAGGSVTLTCSVDIGVGWKFDWFRQESEFSTAQPIRISGSDGVFIITEGGVYSCRGGRGNPVFYTGTSNKVTIQKTVPITPTVIQQPNWAQIYRGERVTLRCEIQDDGGSQWTYEWKPTNRNSPTSSEFMITVDSSGDYKCRGRRRNSFTVTKWGVVTLTVISPKPQPVLSVSPSWPNPGASVTLNCEGLELQSAGWRFFWYKTVPDTSSSTYRYELLPGSTNGTEQNSFIINGPTLTAGFVCRAERGEPKFYTHDSEVKFIWSAGEPEDQQPVKGLRDTGGSQSLILSNVLPFDERSACDSDSAAASLSVNPDRVQHFWSESVTLTCKGNSTEWRVMKFTERDRLSYFFCSHWGRMTGSTCTIDSYWSPSGVFWCESGSGEFSNAVNITVHGDASEYESIQPATMNRSSDDPEDDSVCSCIKTETTETTEC